ncbi:MAG: ATP-binding cassette domain-containing protein [Caldilineaceae bacterium]
MVGRATIPAVKPPEQTQGAVALEVQAVRALDNKDVEALRGISLQVRQGEILGLAGVSGNGQVELAQVLDGTRRTTEGRVAVNGRDVTDGDPTTMMRAGVGRIPEDRHASVVGDLTVAQNMALEHLDEFRRRRARPQEDAVPCRDAHRCVPDQGGAGRPHPHAVGRQHPKGDPGARAGTEPGRDRRGPADARAGHRRHRVCARQAGGATGAGRRRAAHLRRSGRNPRTSRPHRRDL